MRKGTLLGLMAVAVGWVGMSARAEANSAASERWQGYMLRNGLQVPIEVELGTSSADSIGQLRIGGSSVALEHVRIAGSGVHFELPGEGSFDGTVAGNSMAGSVSGGAASGSFTLARESEQPFADPITSSGP